MGVRFRLFGNVEAYLNESPLDIGPARQQAVVAVLLADANRCVSADELISRVWDSRSLPRRPRSAVHTYVSLLRRALANAEDAVIERRPSGYVLQVAEDAIDLHEGRTLIHQARCASEDTHIAILLKRALALWEGNAFGGLDTPWLNSLRAALDKERWAARLELFDIELRCGEHDKLPAALSPCLREHPLDERLAGQYMLALYRSGRQADALEHYLNVRELLVNELGVDPAPALQRLHQQILTADPELSAPATALMRGISIRAGDRPVVPRQMPSLPRFFTGRGRELTRLSDTLAAPRTSRESTAILAISGAAGIGKTWLALHWAHHNLDQFPDGQLYANLQGFGQLGAPMPAGAALRAFLRALGVAPTAIPASQADKAALYRTLIANKRILVMLDNARDTTQVTPLLPGGPLCTVLITSRHQLTGLIVTHGAVHLGLDVLHESEARQLLARHLGDDRVDAEPSAVAALIACCGGLPLALGIVAARAITSRSLPLGAFATELQDSAARIDALADSDPRGGVRAVLSWSYDALDREAADLFGLLGLAQGPDISLPAVAALTGQKTTWARAALRSLTSVNLVQEHMPQRYRMHDLVRLYASSQAKQVMRPDIRAAAVRRLADFYLDTSLICDRFLDPHRPQITNNEPAMCRFHYPVHDPATAMDWLTAEHANLLAAQQLASVHGLPTIVWKLAWALTTFHRRRGHLHDHVRTWQAGLAAAEKFGDPSAQALACRHLGHACALAGRHTEAVGHLFRALAMVRQSGDAIGHAYTHRTLAYAWDEHGDSQRALEHATLALDLFTTLGVPVWRAFSLNQVGWCYAKLGDLAQARARCDQALAMFREHQDLVGQAITWDSLGYIAYQAGDRTQAIGHWQHSVTLLRDTGHSYYEAETLERLADAHAVLGEHAEADDAWRQARELYRTQQRDEHVQRMAMQLAIADQQSPGMRTTSSSIARTTRPWPGRTVLPD